MVDKRTLKFALSDQNEEMKEYAQEVQCQRCEEQQIDLNSAKLR
jgi:cytochrome c-type biogenesis protein CcmH/NrfF